ncbi:MAG: phosphatase PAP2 family protein [Prevotellaceae bacterium]|nr:phosphatase PAP2 family protein [Prevotellaceae bacterium]
MDQLRATDQSLLLLLNGAHCPWLDGVMWALSDTLTWSLLALALLFLVVRAYNLRQFLVFLTMFALAILLADQLSSSLLKPLCHRLRPTHDPSVAGMVHTVRGYLGGQYSFVSSHAANLFALATYVSMVLRGRLLTVSLFLWAALVGYSRVYLGVHYPGDVLCGAMLGILVGWVCYQLFALLFTPGQRPPAFSFLPSCPGAPIPHSAILLLALLFTLLGVCVWAVFI